MEGFFYCKSQAYPIQLFHEHKFLAQKLCLLLGASFKCRA
jgi:hypothetical protein